MKKFPSELDRRNTPTMFSNENVVAWMRPELVMMEHAWHPREKFNTHFVSFIKHPANPNLSHLESFMSDGKQCFGDRKIRLLISLEKQITSHQCRYRPIWNVCAVWIKLIFTADLEYSPRFLVVELARYKSFCERNGKELRRIQRVTC